MRTLAPRLAAVIAATVAAASVVAGGTSVYAQAARMPSREMAPRGARYLSLEDVSPYYQEAPPPKKVKLHDIVTVVVKEQSAVVSEGEVDRRKNGLYEAVLKDWIKLTSSLALKPAPQEDGDPKASGTIQQTYRSNASMEARDRMDFRIAATVVDIRPNGNLVLEAHRNVTFNHEQWEASLSGIIRPEDLLPDNTVLSERIVELSVFKRQKGHVRDGYRRGWMTRIVDAVNPF